MSSEAMMNLKKYFYCLLIGLVGGLIGGFLTSINITKSNEESTFFKTIVAQNIVIVDSLNNPKIALSGKSGFHSINLYNNDGENSIIIGVNKKGFPALILRKDKTLASLRLSENQESKIYLTSGSGGYLSLTHSDSQKEIRFADSTGSAHMLLAVGDNNEPGLYTYYNEHIAYAFGVYNNTPMLNLYDKNGNLAWRKP